MRTKRNVFLALAGAVLILGLALLVFHLRQRAAAQEFDNPIDGPIRAAGLSSVDFHRYEGGEPVETYALDGDTAGGAVWVTVGRFMECTASDQTPQTDVRYGLTLHYDNGEPDSTILLYAEGLYTVDGAAYTSENIDADLICESTEASFLSYREHPEAADSGRWLYEKYCRQNPAWRDFMAD